MIPEVYYKVYYRELDKSYKTVKNGFSWFAWSNIIIWAIWNKHWGILFILVTGVYLASDLASIANQTGNEIALEIFPIVVLFLVVGLPAYAFFKGNSWIEESLQKKGYIFLGQRKEKYPELAIKYYEDQRKDV